MRALLVIAVLAFAAPAVAAPLADHGAVGIATARRPAPFAAAAVAERAAMHSGAIRRVAFLPGTPEVRHASRPLVPASIVEVARMVRVSSHSGAVRIPF